MDKFESHKLNSYSIKELLENPHINGIIYKVFNRYRRAIDLDELDSIQMTILWDCANRYDPSKGAQFTSFLYQQLTFACKNELKKRKKPKVDTTLYLRWTNHYLDKQFQLP